MRAEEDRTCGDGVCVCAMGVWSIGCLNLPALRLLRPVVFFSDPEWKCQTFVQTLFLGKEHCIFAAI